MITVCLMDSLSGIHLGRLVISANATQLVCLSVASLSLYIFAGGGGGGGGGGARGQHHNFTHLLCTDVYPIGEIEYTSCVKVALMLFM